MKKESREAQLRQWLDGASAYTPMEWDRLPELELYMDQVITFLNKQLELFTMDGERLLTPSMINNYVKDGVLPRPVQKKYGREHLAMLMIIYMLKPVLSLPEIDATLQGLTSGERSIKKYTPIFWKNRTPRFRRWWNGSKTPRTRATTLCTARLWTWRWRPTPVM